MIAAIFISLISIVFIVVGFLIWKKEKISLLHNYHYDKVTDKDNKDFCKLSGLGIISIGIGLLITAIIMSVTNSVWSFIGFAIGFVIGLVLLIHAGNIYNR